MVAGARQRERQIDRLRVCNSFRELVRIAKEWVNAYTEMPVSVRRLFKHTHLNTACRLLGVSSLSLEFLPERDASLSEEDADGSEAPKGWTGVGANKPMAEDLEAARNSHAAQSGADAGPSSGASTLETAAAALAGASGKKTVNGRQGKAGRPPQQVVEVGGGAKAGGAGALAQLGRLGGKGAPGTPEKLVPFAVMRGPEVEQERWEVCNVW